MEPTLNWMYDASPAPYGPINWEEAARSPEVIAAFVGNNAAYYQEVFTSAHPKNWNWSGFFFKDLWYLNRKMWREQFTIWGGIMGIQAVLILLWALLAFCSTSEWEVFRMANMMDHLLSAVNLVVRIGGFFFYGYLGNRLYKRRFHKTLERCRNEGVSTREDLLARLSQYGGTDLFYAVGGELFFFALFALFGRISNWLLLLSVQHLM